MHWKASRLLARLPDDTLAPATVIEVRAHVARCARCRQRLHGIQRCEDLLRRIPPALVPVEATPDAYVRLAALARWTDEELNPHPEGWRLSLVSVASVFVIVCVAMSAGSWAPSVRPGFGPGLGLDVLPPPQAYSSLHMR